MGWIESHQSLKNHPKTALLSKKLNITKAQVIGHLHLLWWWCADYSADGLLNRYTPEQIADASDWAGNAGEFLQQMADCGFIDRDPLRVHDWQSYRLHFDLLQSKRERNLRLIRRRVKRWRERNASSNALVTQKTRPKDITIKTLHNQTNIRRVSFSKPSDQEVTAYGASIGFKIDGAAFCDFYKSKGWKVGNSPMKDWKAAVRTWKKRDSNPVKGEVVAVMPGIKLAPGQDPWKEAFEKSEKEAV